MNLRISPRLLSTAVTLATTLAFSASALADLQSEIDRLVAGSPIRSATISISVRDADTDLHLARIRPEEPLLPASNMKLLTTGAALHILGGEFEFRTRMLLAGDRLIIMGDGDPALGDPELLPLVQLGNKTGITVEELINIWVQPIADSGITRLSEIIVDDRIFARELVHPSWPADQLNRPYCAEVPGFSFHLNSLYFYPRPVPGSLADVSRFEPYLTSLDLSSNRCTSAQGPRDTTSFGIARPPHGNKLTFFGNIKTAPTDPQSVTVHDMPQFFAEILAERLRARGISVGSARVANDGDSTQFTGDPIGPTIRTPICTIVTRANRDSENLYAEALLKRMGHALLEGAQPGSWANGASALRWVVNERLDGTNPADARQTGGAGQDFSSLLSGLVVSDGSGLSRENRVTAALLTAWMNTFHRDPVLAPIYIDSLSVGGVSGTLENRFTGFDMGGVIVQGKSGYINDVSCLSGFITATDGRRRSFSILINGMGGKVADAKKLQEAVVAAIANDLMAAKEVEIGG
jgi:D-alanyl-D-alanine carboxypeptidase/D-alanyl-D-alanine-endopeptidase (penicillin-binding protein 4)